MRITVGGVGNVLMGDEAIGPYIVKILEAQYSLSQSVELVDLGAPDLHYVAHLIESDVLILIESILSGTAPGTIKEFRKGDITSAVDNKEHSPLLQESLLIAELAGKPCTNLLVLGVTGKSHNAGTKMSGEVLETVPLLIDRVLRELQNHGATWCRRSTTQPDELWWLSEPAN